MKYKNVVFDFGNVIGRFDGRYMLEQFCQSPKDCDLLMPVVYARWQELDKGKVGYEEYVEHTVSAVPARLEETVRSFFRGWPELVSPIRDTAELIAMAEQAGFPKQVTMFCDSAEPDRIRMWRKAGFLAQGVNKNGARGSVSAQIDWLKQRQLYVSPACAHTIGELRDWKWQFDSVSGAYLDAPVAQNDDAMAALRYGVEGWRHANGGLQVLKTQGTRSRR